MRRSFLFAIFKLEVFFFFKFFFLIIRNLFSFLIKYLPYKIYFVSRVQDYNRFFYFLDRSIIKFLMNFDSYKNLFVLRIKQSDFSILHKNPSKIQKKISFFFAFKSAWFILRYWILAVLIFSFSFYYLTYIRSLPINKVVFEWFLITMFVYWLISGFVFFFKKYQFSKYTSVIQRFWKRTYILFWMIESGVFLVFFYLTMNASEEPVFMFDQIKLFKTHLFSWRLFVQKLFPVLFLIVFGYFILLQIKWNYFSQISLLIFITTLFLLLIVWLEFYQFFHIISFYGNLNWIYSYDDFSWSLEHEFRRTRLANNYVTVCLIAKFWHLIFIFIFWIFFVLRINELRRVRYSLFAANSQNFIILYIMSWLYMYPWLKFIFRGFMDSSYYWFFFSNRYLSLHFFFNDFTVFFGGFFSVSSLFYFKNSVFFYWVHSVGEEILQFKKHFLRDYIISDLT